MAKRRARSQQLIPRDRVLAIIESFDGATGTPVLSHLKLQVGKKLIGWYMDNHHGNGRLEINCRGRPGRSQQLFAKNPDVYFVPSYHGKKGDIGIWLDVDVIDWDEVAQILFEACAIANPDVVMMRKPAHTTAKRKGNNT